MKHAIVNITSWVGISPDAVHYYAKLQIVESKKNIYKVAKAPYSQKEIGEEVELSRVIDQKEADYLNKKDNADSWCCGDTVLRFNNIDEIKIAVAEYLKENNLVCNVALLRNRELRSDDDFVINIKEEIKKTNVKIKITKCLAFGKQFENLTPDSVHDVIEAPERYKSSKVVGVWVMGVGEPVKVLPNEYITLK